MIATDPGASGPFSPPAKWTGDDGEYTALLRERYITCHAARQQIAVAASERSVAAFTGRYAGVARGVLVKIAQRRSAGL